MVHCSEIIMKRIKVLFFAMLQERTNKSEIYLDLDDQARVIDLKSKLTAQFPTVEPLFNSALVSINQEYAFDEDPIPNQAEVALFPPVSGGSSSEEIKNNKRPIITLITEDEISIDHLVSQITLPNTGAACVFTGTVRGETHRGRSHQTDYLDYDAYIPMAEQKMYQVADEIYKEWPEIEGIAIVQRIGRLFPGTPTIIIACTAGHRDSGVFEAARYGIDRLKQIVPIWKKEVGPEGQVWVEGEYIPNRHD
jgi:molybdopterin synthase catalytic subunit